MSKDDKAMTQPTCGLCGEPMPEGEEMFKYHGHSGHCARDFDLTRDDLISMVDRFRSEQIAELEIWRTRYPDQAGFIREEAVAGVEGREPQFGPPIVRG